MTFRSRHAATALIMGVLSLLGRGSDAVGGPLAAVATGPAPVTLQQDDTSYTLSNGIVTARISKQSGDLTSLVYRGVETLTDRSGHAGGYWSHDARSAQQTRK